MTETPPGRPSEPRTGPAAPAPAHGDGLTRPSAPTGRTEPHCPAQTGPVWKADGEPCGCVLPDGHTGDHQCSCGAWWVDSIRRDRTHA